jgi:DNA-binding NtrC family response regulator
MPTVLVIDDNPAVATALEVLFSLRDLRTLRADSPAAGLAVLAREPVDVVVQDMNFRADTTSGADGATLFHTIRARFPDVPVILLTAWTQLESAVALVKAGATDYIAKPWDDDKLLATVNTVVELSETRRELAHRRAVDQRHRAELEQRYDLRNIVFVDPAMERVVALACQVARADVPVLITGPNGAGKDKIAEIVQANSAVKTGPFVTLNCGALPSELIEAELFGAEVGAYTGANRAREGKFESADGGTLFLDEIGDLPLTAQSKLLRVLQEGEIERLGDQRTRRVNVRVVAASNTELLGLVKEARFRSDLYYRLNPFQIHIPPLRDRKEDIPLLAKRFLEKHSAIHAKKLRGFTDKAKRALLTYPWPGNVRELQNMVERGVILAPNGSSIEVSHLFTRCGDAQAQEFGLDGDGNLDLHRLQAGRELCEVVFNGVMTLDQVEAMLIETAVDRAHGNLSAASRLLGLRRPQLAYRLKRLHEPAEAEGSEGTEGAGP